MATATRSAHLTESPPLFRLRFLAALRVTAGLILTASLSAVSAHAALPDGFSDQPVASGLVAPSSIAFLPDGRALIAELSPAQIRLVRNGVVTNLGTVPNVRAGGERGLLGLTVDPAWPARPYVYIHSTWNLSFQIRISRFTLTGDLDDTGAGDLTLDAASRHEVLTGLPDNTSIHNGGTVRFGPDSMLLVSVGDDAEACDAQETAFLQGKILRLDVRGLPDGPGGPPAHTAIAPADNPFPNAADTRERLVWSYGLRNPFRFTVDPLSGALYVADVGQDSWEEMTEVLAGGANCGWPWFEGLAGYGVCTGSTPVTLSPIHVYDHDRPGQHAIIAGPRYRRGPPTSFPAPYEGDVFFSDFYKGELVRLHHDGFTWAVAAAVAGQPSPAFWGTGYSFVSDYQQAADGSIWYLNQSSGEVRRIVADPPVNDVAGNPGLPLPDAATYDIQGRRVDRPERGGIYFRRGRRVVLLP